MFELPIENKIDLPKLPELSRISLVLSAVTLFAGFVFSMINYQRYGLLRGIVTFGASIVASKVMTRVFFSLQYKFTGYNTVLEECQKICDGHNEVVRKTWLVLTSYTINRAKKILIVFPGVDQLAWTSQIQEMEFDLENIEFAKICPSIEMREGGRVLRFPKAFYGPHTGRLHLGDEVEIFDPYMFD